MINDTKLIGVLGTVAPELPVGDALKDATEVDFNLTDLVSMISILQPSAGEVHSFTMNLEDNAGNTFTETCSFRTPEN